MALCRFGTSFKSSDPAFCAVARADDHPSRPANARPLDGFWRNRGFQLRPGLTCTMRWPELGAMADTAHTMQFWTKDLARIDTETGTGAETAAGPA